jgi:PAS domain S-box-containing protein
MFKTKLPDAMPLLKYALKKVDSEEFEERYWSVLNTPVLDENRNITYIIQRGEDVTEYVRLKNKDAEQGEIWAAVQKTQKDYFKQLKENEEKFRLLVERAKDYAIFMVDITGHVLSWNEGAKKIKGYTSDEIIGKHISVFYTEESIKNNEPELNLKTAREKGCFENSGWRLRKNGSRFWADIIYTSIYNDRGILKGYWKIIRDFTEKKLAADKITQLNEELIGLNAKLNYLNLEKDRFVGMVSHDLQNDVSAMMLTISILEKNTEIKNENQLKYIKRLHRSVTNMYRLLRNFLSVNRIQLGIINPDYTPVDIGSQAEEMVEEYTDIAALKNLKLNFLNECKDDLLDTDKSYLGIILDNLISNAIKYSPKGGEIDMKVSKTGDKYHFEIKDQGPGIPACDMPKLYGRFQKLTARPTAGEPSHGLGLSIVKDLVDALKGTIECSSIEGKGTTFNVMF